MAASAFWGGFASTLLDERTKNEDAQRDEKSLEKRMRLQKDLEAEYSTTEIEDVDQAGKPIIRRINQNGEEKGRRYMTSAEAENRTLAKRKLLAQISGEEASAEVNKKQAANYDEDRASVRADRAADNARANASLGLQERGLAIQASSTARADAREERIATAQLDANSARTLASTKLDEAAQIISTNGVDPSHAARTMTTLKGGVDRILASSGSEADKKARINNLISRFKAQLPSLKPATAGSGNAGNLP